MVLAPLCLLVSGAVAAFISLSGTPSTTFQFTAFAQPGPPHLLDDEITFGYLPAGFHLVSDERVNKTTQPARYQRIIVYGGHAQNGAEQVTLSIDQGAGVVTVPTKAPSSPVGATYALGIVRGHRTLLETTPSPGSGRRVTYSIVGGRRQEVVTCWGPNSSGTILGAQQMSAKEIAATCLRIEAGLPLQPKGSPIPVTNVVSNAYPKTVLQWTERRGVSFELDGSGLTLTALEHVAAAIQYRASIGDCIDAGRALSGGACASGIVGSPPLDSSLVPVGGTELASGKVDGERWALSANPQAGDAWVTLEYANASGAGARDAYWLFRPVPTIALDITDNRERFLYGMVPPGITSVTATPRGGRPITTPLLPAKLSGWAFFVLPLGKTSSICGEVCPGTVRIALAAGSRTVYSGTWNNAGEFQVRLQGFRSYPTEGGGSTHSPFFHLPFSGELGS